MKRWLILLIFTSSMAHAIGRTGNRVIDEDDGFSAIAPESYYEEQSMGHGNLRILDPMASLALPGRPMAMLELLRVVNAYPEFQKLTRAEIVHALGNDGWYALPSFDPCVQVFAQRSPSTALGLALWGQSKGLLIRAPNSNENWQAVNVILTSLKIEKGACDWK